MAVGGDDPVGRVVDRAMAAQTRLLLTYMDQMRETIRREVEKELRDEFSGEQIYMGKGTADRTQARDAAIVADSAAGLSLRALARKYHLSKSQVSRVLVKDETGGGKNGDSLIEAERR